MPGAADTASAMACLAVAAAVGAVARVPPARVCARACRAARALAVSPHPARRRPVLRRARRDTDSERPSKDGTLDALDNVLGVEPEDEAPPDPSRDADAVPPSRPPVPPAEASSRRLSDAAEDDDDDGWRPWFSPRSDVYDVPVSRPSAAYILALIHVLVFLGDYALYATGNGNGGDLFLRLAEVDDALVRGSQWTRPFTACLVDYGLVHFAVSNLALVTVGAEAEALLGLYPFLSVYVLTGAVGVLTVTAFDPNTSLSALLAIGVAAFGLSPRRLRRRVRVLPHQHRAGVEQKRVLRAMSADGGVGHRAGVVGGDADAGRGARGEQRGARVGVCGGRDDGSARRGAALLERSVRTAGRRAVKSDRSPGGSQG